jgi:hypothetical protein
MKYILIIFPPLFSLFLYSCSCNCECEKRTGCKIITAASSSDTVTAVYCGTLSGSQNITDSANAFKNKYHSNNFKVSEKDSLFLPATNIDNIDCDDSEEYKKAGFNCSCDP